MFSKTIMEVLKKKISYHCGNTDDKMQSCGNCGISYYCSLKCQKLGWTSHKNFCKGDRKENKDDYRYINDRLSGPVKLL